MITWLIKKNKKKKNPAMIPSSEAMKAIFAIAL